MSQRSHDPGAPAVAHKMTQPSGVVPRETEDASEHDGKLADNPERLRLARYAFGRLNEADARETARRIDTDDSYFLFARPLLVRLNSPPAPMHCMPQMGRRPSREALAAYHGWVYRKKLQGRDRRMYSLVHRHGWPIAQVAWINHLDAGDGRMRLARANWHMAQHLWRAGMFLSPSDLEATVKEVRRLRAEVRAKYEGMRFLAEAMRHTYGRPRPEDDLVEAKPMPPSVRMDMELITGFVAGELDSESEAAVVRRLSSDMAFFGWAGYVLLAWSIPPKRDHLD